MSKKPYLRWCYKRGDSYGKIMILTFHDNEQYIIDKIMEILTPDIVQQSDSISTKQELHFGDLIISPARRVVLLKGTEIFLTTREFDVLFFMASHPNHVFTMKQLYKSTIHEPYYETFHTVSSAIYRIRKKIGADYIVNVHSYGHKFTSKDN